MAKICLDALNGVAYTDHAIINRLNISKRYGEEPKVKILIYENTGGSDNKYE
jgi:Holliday junction resolvase RusA-like endonuclease